MTKEEGRSEIVYQMTMSAAKKMLKKGLITREEYIQFEGQMKEKYSPKIGSLFSNLNLQ